MFQSSRLITTHFWWALPHQLDQERRSIRPCSGTENILVVALCLNYDSAKEKKYDFSFSDPHGHYWCTLKALLHKCWKMNDTKENCYKSELHQGLTVPSSTDAAVVSTFLCISSHFLAKILTKIPFFYLWSSPFSEERSKLNAVHRNICILVVPKDFLPICICNSLRSPRGFCAGLEWGAVVGYVYACSLQACTSKLCELEEHIEAEVCLSRICCWHHNVLSSRTWSLSKKT